MPRRRGPSVLPVAPPSRLLGVVGRRGRRRGRRRRCVFPLRDGGAGGLARRRLPRRGAGHLDGLGRVARRAHRARLGARVQLLPHPADRALHDRRERELGRARGVPDRRRDRQLGGAGRAGARDRGRAAAARGRPRRRDGAAAAARQRALGVAARRGAAARVGAGPAVGGDRARAGRGRRAAASRSRCARGRPSSARCWCRRGCPRRRCGGCRSGSCRASRRCWRPGSTATGCSARWSRRARCAAPTSSRRRCCARSRTTCARR